MGSTVKVLHLKMMVHSSSYRVDTLCLEIPGERVLDGGVDDASAASRLAAHDLGPGQVERITQIARQARARRHLRSVHYRRGKKGKLKLHIFFLFLYWLTGDWRSIHRKGDGSLCQINIFLSLGLGRTMTLKLRFSLHWRFMVFNGIVSTEV